MTHIEIMIGKPQPSNVKLIKTTKCLFTSLSSSMMIGVINLHWEALLTVDCVHMHTHTHSTQAHTCRCVYLVISKLTAPLATSEKECLPLF